MARRAPWWILLSVAGLTQIGCLITPYPAKRITALRGATAPLDLSKLNPGVTTSAEVVALLGLPTGPAGGSVYWYRLRTSNKGMIFMVGDEGAADRIWKNFNLLVHFDEAGVVTALENVDDDKLIDAFQRAIDAREMTIGFGVPLRVSMEHAHARHGNGSLLFADNSLAWREMKTEHEFTAPADILTAVARKSYCPFVAGGDTSICLELTFRSPTAVGKSTRVRIRIDDLPVLVAYVHRRAGGAQP